ncbi:GDSL-type esterase/lipase family protein [Psychrobacillus sp. FSL W7-1457]|uniref:GDSL-type esterase/lipase family protein n=1 Tax=Psychrobacillus sp. FSL W7-1457 TaxID=2954547 RepID=UPI00315A4F27
MTTVVCFGDSITARKEGNPSPALTYKLSQKLPNYNFINAGVSGNTTEQAIERFAADVIAKKPDYVTVLFGSNDSATYRLVDLELFKRNITTFAKVIGPSKTILISPPPVDESLQENRSNESLLQYTTVVREVAEETGSHYIDFFTAMYSREDYKELLVGEKNDGLHFGEAGYDMLSDLIAQKLIEINLNHPKKGLLEKVIGLFFEKEK